MGLINSKYIYSLELKEWAVRTINNPWDFTKFLEYPLIKLDNKYLLSLNEDFIINLSFEGLYHKIRHIYPGNSTDVIRFLGKPFEKYVELLTKNAVEESKKNNYKFIPEFKYGKGGGQASSDAYIKIDNTLIIIEAKSKRPVFTTLFTDDDAKIVDGIDTVYTTPVVQAFDSFERIMKSNKSNIFLDIEEIYIISVNLMGIPRISEVEKVVKDKIGNKLGGNVIGSMNLTIEEFEYLCSLIGSGYNVLSLLRYYCSENYFSPFINFIHDKVSNENLKWLDQNYNRVTSKTMEILFNK